MVTGEQAHEEMRQACFDYLSLGGIYSSGPISLLSGLNPKPSVLVMHFFMVRYAFCSLFSTLTSCVHVQVALYGCGRLMWPRPSFHGLKMASLLLIGASQIILPIIYAEGIVAVFFPWFASRPTKAMQRVSSAAQLLSSSSAKAS